MKKFARKYSQKIVYSLFLIAALWGLGRLYFTVNDGFLVSNIVSDLRPSVLREVRAPTPDEEAIWQKVSSQPWNYLGKGCQSYVFESEDQKYVLKFFKHQRFRPQSWLTPFTFIPAVKAYQEEKQAKREAKLAYFMQAWKIAFDDLYEESGIVRVHLNKSDNLKVNFNLKDKLGLTHTVFADDVEFLVQVKAEPLAGWINKNMKEGNKDKVRALLNDLVTTLVSEYQRGLSDNDPALLQNTGVFQDRPFHIDVGQFEKSDRFKDPNLWAVELYNKTYEFRFWLLDHHPEMGQHLTMILKETLGPKWDQMKPFFGRIH